MDIIKSVTINDRTYYCYKDGEGLKETRTAFEKEDCREQLSVSFDSIYSIIQTVFDDCIKTVLEIEPFVTTSDETEQAIKAWSEFGWVPFLDGVSLLNESVPSTQAQADSLMINLLEEKSIDDLFQCLINVTNYRKNNTKTLEEGIAAYRSKLYLSCAMNLFAAIDNLFLTDQVIMKGRDRRDLTREAMRRLHEYQVLSPYFEIIECLKKSIDFFYKSPKDFCDKDISLKRNYICHGVNRYYPDRNDCLKLFILYYNVVFLFQINAINWEYVEDDK